MIPILSVLGMLVIILIIISGKMPDVLLDVIWYISVYGFGGLVITISLFAIRNGHEKDIIVGSIGILFALIYMIGWYLRGKEAK